MSDQRPRSEFADVDQANVPESYVQLLDVQRSIPFVQMYKQRARNMLDLQPGQQVLDVGAGTGEDALEMARLVAPTGQVVGMDFSQTMVNVAQQCHEASNLPLRFTQGDAHHLPFANNIFDRCYADKTF